MNRLITHARMYLACAPLQIYACMYVTTSVAILAQGLPRGPRPPRAGTFRPPARPAMARLCLFRLLPLLPSLASMLQGRPAPCDSAGDAWRGVAGLPAEILRKVLELVPRLPVVAWETFDGGWRLVRPDTQPDWVLGEDRHMRFWPGGDRVLTWAHRAECNVMVWDMWTGRPLQTLRHSALAPGPRDYILLDAKVSQRATGWPRLAPTASSSSGTSSQGRP